MKRFGSSLITGALCSLVLACGSGEEGVSEAEQERIRNEILAELQDQFDKIDENADALQAASDANSEAISANEGAIGSAQAAADANATAIGENGAAISENAEEISMLEMLLAEQEALLAELQDLIDSFVQALIPTRADAIATSIAESWNDNEISVNLSSNEDSDYFRHFVSTDGAGIVAFCQGDDGDEFGYLGFHDSTGALVESTLMRGPLGSDGIFGGVEDMAVIWTPNGDAIISLVVYDERDESVAGDVSTRRTFFGYFKRELANTPIAESGERYGFSRLTPIDTNVVGVDDNHVDSLFVASNLIDGSHEFSRSGNTLGVSGPKGDAEEPFLYLGWTNRDENGDRRVEGQYVDLEKLQVIGSPEAIAIPGLDAGENVEATVRTSGRDMLFTFYDDGTPLQQRLVLARANPSQGDVGTPISVGRGDNTAGLDSNIGIRAFIGDGYRALNGQSSTWIVYEEDNFENATATQADNDLLIAQIDAAGAVSVSEVDHEAQDSAASNHVDNVRVQINRGATAAYVYYQQTFDTAVAAVETESSLFARALRLDDTASLADNVSAEVTVNTLHDTDNSSDSDVYRFEIAERDAFGGADSNPNTSYVAYRQYLDGDADGTTFRARLLEIEDMSADPVVLTPAAEEVIVPLMDSGIGQNDLVVLPGSASSGEGIVFFEMNGNNPDDNEAEGYFSEHRPFVYAKSLAGGVSLTTPVQVGSDSGAGVGDRWGEPAQFRTLESDSVGLQGRVTPDTAAARDFSANADVGTPEQAVFVFGEYIQVDDSETGTTYRSRTLDLTDAQANLADRWVPVLANGPAQLGPDDGHEFEDISDVTLSLLPRGNDIAAIFNIETHDDNGGNGRFFINTMVNGQWSTAALLTNDTADPLNDGENPFVLSGANYEIIPGVSEDGREAAVGTWLWWLRENTLSDDESNEQFLLQGRRIFSLDLPAQ